MRPSGKKVGASLSERRRSTPAVPEMGPGAMTFDRTPRGPSSTAMTAESASTAAFAAAQCAWYGVATNARLSSWTETDEKNSNWNIKKTFVVMSCTNVYVGTLSDSDVR